MEIDYELFKHLGFSTEPSKDYAIDDATAFLQNKQPKQKTSATRGFFVYQLFISNSISLSCVGNLLNSFFTASI